MIAKALGKKGMIVFMLNNGVQINAAPMVVIRVRGILFQVIDLNSCKPNAVINGNNAKQTAFLFYLSGTRKI